MVGEEIVWRQYPDELLVLAARVMRPGTVPVGLTPPELAEHERVLRESDNLHAAGVWTPRRLMTRADELGLQDQAADLLRVAATHDPAALDEFAAAIVHACDVEDAGIEAAETIARVDRMHPGEPGFADAMRSVHEATAAAIRAIEGDRPVTLSDLWTNPRDVEPDLLPTRDVWSEQFRWGAIERGRLIGIGGTSGTGKTALATDFVVHALEHGDGDEVVLWANLDMSHADLVMRLQQRHARRTPVELQQHGCDMPAWADAITLHRDKGVRSLVLAIERLRPSLVVVDMAQQVRPARERSSAVEAVDAALDQLCDSLRDAESTALLVAQASKAAASSEPDLATAFRGTTTFVHSLDVAIVGRIVAKMADRDDGGQANGVEWHVLKNRIGQAGSHVLLDFDPHRLTFDRPEAQTHDIIRDIDAARAAARA